MAKYSNVWSTHAKVLHHMSISGSIGIGTRADEATVPHPRLTKKGDHLASCFTITTKECVSTANVNVCTCILHSEVRPR